MKKQYRLSELTQGLEVSIQGDPDCLISGVSPIQDAKHGHITFLTNSGYRKYLQDTKATAVILSEKDAAACPVNAVISKNPHFTYAKMSSYFAERVVPAPGIHATVVVGEGAQIHPSASVGANCVLGKAVVIGENAIIGPGCVIGDFSVIGKSTVLDARVSIYHSVMIGERCSIASGVVIGSDGFGFANHQSAWHKVAQLGGVRIGDDVDIGANTTIDRGAVGDTIIENGVKLDNLIQVGHNAQIGANTLICGCVAIAGSTIIGKNCMIGGATCFAGHLTVCDGAMITGMSSVTKSILEPGIYSSGIVGMVTNEEFRKNNARFHRLGSLMERVKTLELALKALTERASQ